MLPNAFIGKAQKPTDAELTAALGPAKALWDRLLGELADEHNLTVQEWKSYSLKAGWSLRLKRKRRNIVYLSPCRDCFRVMFILGDNAMAAARQSGLPQTVIKILSAAPRYPEGTGVRLEIKKAKDIGAITKLAGIKLSH
jgi:hypothetical protein